MGYRTNASVALGVIIKAESTRATLAREHAEDDVSTVDDLLGWIQDLCEQHHLHLHIQDTTRHEDFGCDDNNEPLWEREFAVAPRDDTKSYGSFAKNLLRTEFWGHSAVASVTASLPLDQVRLTTAEREAMDQLLGLLQLDPRQYPTRLLLFHQGD